jgi:N-acetylmuramoyl-L-alanine amidase
VRRAALLVPLLLAASVASAPSARRAPDCIEASTRSGPAPLHVSLRSTCTASSYRWDLGDGASATGEVVEHDFAGGAYRVTLERSLGDGSTERSSIEIEALALTLDEPPVTRYGKKRAITGALVPGEEGVEVSLERDGEALASTLTRAGGRFGFRIRIKSPGPYAVRSGEVVSPATVFPVRPRLRVWLDGLPIVGLPLRLRTKLEPAGAGELRIVMLRDNRRVADRVLAPGKSVSVSTARSARYVVWVSAQPGDGYRAVTDKLRFQVAAPSLAFGSRGPSVTILERALVEHRFALLSPDSVYGEDTVDAIYAVQKLAGLNRSGRVDAATWRALLRARPPRPSLSGDYVEVDKTKQLLYVVRDRRVTLIVPVSTGATGNTPVGLWHVYSKIAGWSWVLYYPNYFLRGFAIHGYPSVPPWPASHGCVRVPMWVAIRLFNLIPYGTRVFIRY